MSACLGTDTLLDMIEGRATPEQRARIEEHASRCAECRRVMSSLAREPSGEESTIAASDLPAELPREDLAVGDRVARYVIRARLGAGGMGIVYAALDPELGREVAIKVLSPRLGGSTGRSMFEERLRREARALAQLAHPNVVAIHDVGHVGKRLFIAMELLDGETLAGWCRAKTRAPREILERFLEAGRGLAAAHAAGIVHRDVKPENMMLGREGRVRVVDFGLARTQDEPGEEGGDSALAAGSDGSLTTPGAVMGTPHYMAPEQHRGEQVDARTDQFAFCVALYFALYGMRPFEGEDLESLGRAVGSGAVREPPRRRGVPRRIWKALRRGMSPRPADRFPTLDALLAQVTPPRRPWWIPAAGVVAAGTAATVALFVHQPPPRPCEGMEQHLAGIWDPARRASLEVAIRHGGAPFADATAKTVLARLDDYTARWVSTRADACTATRVRREQTDAVMSQRMACLDDRLQEVNALVDTLATADREGLSHAVAAADQLTDLASCADAELLRLRAKPPQDPALVASVRAKLASARAMEVTGKYREALALVTGLAPDVTRAAYRPLEAEAALVEGLLQSDVDADQAAVAALERAVFAAEASGHDPIAAKALIQLVDVRGQHAEFEESDAAHTRATAALERIGRAPRLAADLDYVFGVVQIVRGDLEAAEQALTRALHTAEGIRGAELSVAATLAALGRVGMRRMNGTAEPFLERAKAIEEKLLGPDHPDVAAVLLALGGAAYERADYTVAAAHYERAISILDRSVGHESAQMANAYNNLANVRQWQGREADALVAIREAVAIDDKVLPKADPQRAQHLETESEVLEQLDRHDEALVANTRALAMLREMYGEEHQDIADALHGRALIELAAGKLDAALADARTSLAMFGRVNPDYPMMELRRTLGRIELALGDARSALVDLEIARELLDDTDEPVVHAWVNGLYGRALVETGRDRAKGLAIVNAAYRVLGADDRAESEAAELGTWMRARGIALPATARAAAD